MTDCYNQGGEYCAVNAESLCKTDYVFFLEGLMLELLEMLLYQNAD